MNPETNHIDAAIADLEGWEDRIHTAIETLKMLRTGGGALPGLPVSASPRTPMGGEIQHDTFFQMTVPDAAEKLLTLAKKTKSTAELAEGLLKGGLKSAAKNFPSMLNSVLFRDSRFVRVNREWGLDSWYPGMRKGAARKRSQGSIADAPTETRLGFSMDSLRGRVLTLINSEPHTRFDSKTIAGRLGVDNVPSVNAALSTLIGAGLITRPEKGRYESK